MQISCKSAILKLLKSEFSPPERFLLFYVLKLRRVALETKSFSSTRNQTVLEKQT